MRTYRGRKLEDLIPQIREELGPDAIILRQREGLMGGVGGFFAQKCVEVDAQAAPNRSVRQIDIYDEDEPVSGWDEGIEDFVARRPAAPAATPALPAPEPPAPTWEQQAASDREQTTPAIEAAARRPGSPSNRPRPPPRSPLRSPSSPLRSRPTQSRRRSAPAPPANDLTAESFVSRLEQAAAHVDIEELVKLVTSGRVTRPRRRRPAALRPARRRPRHAHGPCTQYRNPRPSAPAPVVGPAAGSRPRQAPVPPPAPGPVVEQPVPAPVPPAANHWVAKQAGDLDSDEAAAVTAELTSQGISEDWAQQLIVAASAHRSPLSQGQPARRGPRHARRDHPRAGPAAAARRRDRVRRRRRRRQDALRRRAGLGLRQGLDARRERGVARLATTGAATSRNCSRARTSG